MTLCTEPRATPFAALDQRRRVNLNNALAAHLVPDKSDAAVLAWFWQFLGGAPVLSSFGTRETTTAAPMNQNYTLASRPADQPGGWAVLSRGTFSGAILLTDV